MGGSVGSVYYGAAALHSHHAAAPTFAEDGNVILAFLRNLARKEEAERGAPVLLQYAGRDAVALVSPDLVGR